MEKYLMEIIEKSLSDMDNAIAKLEVSSGARRITEYMNIMYSIGKYSGLLYSLKEVNIDEMIKVHEMSTPRVGKAMRVLEGLYHES